MELDFDKIVGGEDQQKKKQQLKPKEVKMSKTEVKARQGSCMITDIDKDLLPASSHNKGPAGFRVSLSDMLSIDKTDESLQNYKKNLLGEIKEQQLKQDEAAEVEIIKVEVVCPDRPGGNIHLDFTKDTTKIHFQIKQGSVYCLRIHFIVRYDIVNGLKFVNNVFKTLMRVEKQQQKMGSFAPQAKPHYFDLEWVEAPSGMLVRGDYKGKGLFLDNQGIVHCQFDYVFTIAKDW